MNDFFMDFVGIGAPKAGTTWIASCLEDHPQICLSDPKELNYFLEKGLWVTTPSMYPRGETWLRGRFRRYQPGQIRGEFSVNYLHDPASPGMIKRCYPNAKIIASLRNPVDALYSLYFQFAREYPVPSHFEGFLDKYPEYLNFGNYYSHLSCFLDCFPREQTHLILFDDIVYDPASVLRSLYAFLGVDSGYVSAGLYRKVNDRKSPRSVLIRDLLGNAVDTFRTNPHLAPFTRLLRKAGIPGMVMWLQARNLTSTTQPRMRVETRQMLQELYTPENTKLGSLLGRNLDGWSKDNA
jgi:hypothetical protein